MRKKTRIEGIISQHNVRAMKLRSLIGKGKTKACTLIGAGFFPDDKAARAHGHVAQPGWTRKTSIPIAFSTPR